MDSGTIADLFARRAIINGTNPEQASIKEMEACLLLIASADLHRVRALCRPLEDHVLYKVADPADLRRLLARPHAHINLHSSRPRVRHSRRDDSQPIW